MDSRSTLSGSVQIQRLVWMRNRKSSERIVLSPNVRIQRYHVLPGIGHARARKSRLSRVSTVGRCVQTGVKGVVRISGPVAYWLRTKYFVLV